MNSTNILTVNRTTKTLSTEVSVLELTNHAHALNELHFRSDRTGKEAVFLLTHVESDDEGETLYWRYTPSVATRLENPSLKDWQLVVFND